MHSTVPLSRTSATAEAAVQEEAGEWKREGLRQRVGFLGGSNEVTRSQCYAQSNCTYSGSNCYCASGPPPVCSCGSPSVGVADGTGACYMGEYACAALASAAAGLGTYVVCKATAIPQRERVSRSVRQSRVPQRAWSCTPQICVAATEGTENWNERNRFDSRGAHCSVCRGGSLGVWRSEVCLGMGDRTVRGHVDCVAGGASSSMPSAVWNRLANCGSEPLFGRGSRRASP